MKQRTSILFFVIAFAFLFHSCVSIAEYQKMYLNDSDMQLSDHEIEGFGKSLWRCCVDAGSH